MCDSDDKLYYRPEVNLGILAGDLQAVLRELHELRAENEELRKYREDYFALLNSSIKHGEQMAGQVITLLLNQGRFPEDAPAEPE